MQGIVEIASINDINNIIESKACGLSLIYHITTQDVKNEETTYKMIVKMDLKCNPKSVFYTKTLDLENLEKQCVVSKTYNNRWDRECKSKKEIKENPLVKNELENNIQGICTKLS